MPDELRQTLQSLQQQIKNIAGQQLAVANRQFYDEVRKISADLDPLIEQAKQMAVTPGAKPAPEIKEGLEAYAAVKTLIDYETALAELFRGPLRAFLAEVYPGPAAVSRKGQYSVQAWRTYFQAESRAIFFHRDESAKMLDIITRQAWDEVEVALKIPTREELFKRTGWDIIFNDEGRLMSIKAPTGTANSAWNSRFQQFFNDFEIA